MKNKIAFFTTILVFAIILSTVSLKSGYTVSADDGDFTTPATVQRVTSQLLAQKIDSRTDETYMPSSRIWQGLPTVGVMGKRIWVAWETGGPSEPHKYNYIAVAYSDDDGKTWVDPYLVIDHPAQSKDVYVNCPSFWVNDDGKLCLNYTQYGTWTVVFDNAGAENIADVTWHSPVLFSRSRIAKAPIKVIDIANKTSKSCLMYACESEAGDSHPEVTRIYASEDDGKNWTLRGKIVSKKGSARKSPESNLVQTSSGRLIVVSRLEDGVSGGIETAYSDDLGKTWSEYTSPMTEPFIGPGSKCHIEKLASGNLIMINHSTTSSRDSLKAYYSADGESWKECFSIDSRTDVTYPYVFTNGDKIYVTWDKGRYIEKEIRLSIFRESDLIAGEIVSEDSHKMIAVSRLNKDYKEITEVKTAFENRLRVSVGTDGNEIREKLPSAVTVTDNDGTEYVLNGVWSCKGYDKNKEGVNVFVFNAEMPANLADNYGMLVCRVEVAASESKGCPAFYRANGAIVSAIILAVSLFIIFKTTRKSAKHG